MTSDRQTLTNLLAKQFLFELLSPAEFDRLLAFARVVPHRAGSTIFAQGSPGDSLIAVIEGEVNISAPSVEGREVIFAVMKPGQTFGEVALLDGKDRTADAVARTDCRLLVIHRRDFMPFLNDHPQIALRLLPILCEQIRRMSEQVQDALFLDQPTRLAKKLLSLAAERGQPTPQGKRLGLHLSQRELGNFLGIPRETVNRQLRFWRAEGMIALDDGTITLTDEAALRQIAGLL
ncbi:MAG TPA: Crp/Fnr family transcriptional regulator [Stellaceae bacterium]|nr:Crp/Fnr family transcriptional regulator [Stellaceae bacterium]